MKRVVGGGAPAGEESSPPASPEMEAVSEKDQRGEKGCSEEEKMTGDLKFEAKVI